MKRSVKVDEANEAYEDIHYDDDDVYVRDDELYGTYDYDEEV